MKGFEASPRFVDSLIAYGAFEDLLSKLIKEYKYNLHFSLAKTFAFLLSEVYFLEFGKKSHDFIIPFPSHYLTIYSRGFDHILLICEALSKMTQIGLLANIIVKCKKTKSQASLDFSGRKNNISSNDFKIKLKDLLKNKRVLLVDDVCTTGASLEALANVLKLKGCVQSIDCLVLASTRLNK
ncbi:MAG: phosphoribosyltransferase family protein [Pseudomonadota bacterium]